jgi:hypothetical protein
MACFGSNSSSAHNEVQYLIFNISSLPNALPHSDVSPSERVDVALSPSKQETSPFSVPVEMSVSRVRSAALPF